MKFNLGLSAIPPLNNWAQVYERVRISIVEVYERVEKSVSFGSVKGPKRANRRILWL